MALSISNSSSLSSKSLHIPSKSTQPAFSSSLPTNRPSRSRPQIAAVHASELAKSKFAVKESKPSPPPSVSRKWAVDSWKTKTALQLPEYPDAIGLESVIKAIEDLFALVFAGEARSYH